MIYPQVDLNEWIKKWGLEIIDWKCPQCLQYFKTTVPVMTKNSAGLITPEHGCENMYTFIGTPRTEEALAFWNQIV